MAFLKAHFGKLSHIDQLNRMLEGIRKPYLDVDAVPSFLTRASRTSDPQSSSSSWENITHLSNEQRDQFDLQARQILTRCANRVKELETVEKRKVMSFCSTHLVLTNNTTQSDSRRLLPNRHLRGSCLHGLLRQPYSPKPQLPIS